MGQAKMVDKLITARRRKFTLLGETVFPYLYENRVDDLKAHENLRIILDDIKNLSNQIQLAERRLQDMTNEDLLKTPGLDRDRLQDEIENLEGEIENRLQELRLVKESISQENDNI